MADLHRQYSIRDKEMLERRRHEYEAELQER